MDSATPYKSKLRSMDTSYKSKLRAYSDAPPSTSSFPEMKYSGSSSGKINKATIKYDFKTPLPAKMCQTTAGTPSTFTPPPAPRPNRSILELMEIDSPHQNNNDFEERTPKRRSLRKSRLSEVAPSNTGGGNKSKRTQTKSMDAEIAKLKAENLALNNSIAQKNQEIANIKRRSQSFVENLRTMAQNFSFNEN